VSFRIDARTRKNVGVDPQEPPRDETGVDATGVALNEVQLGKLAIKGALTRATSAGEFRVSMPWCGRRT
jgi:hypothetical protein